MKAINSHRYTIRIISFLVVVLTVVPLSFAQTAVSSLASQAALVTEFEVNGLKVLVKRRPNSPTVSAGLFFRGGTRSLTPQNAGIESFALNVATEGSVKFPRAVMRRELASTGSNISSGSNYDFSALALASTREKFDRSWEIFTDVAMNPAFAPEDVELTRGKILSGLQSRDDDPDGHLQELVDKTILAKTTYGSDPSGTIESVGRFTAADLRAYHQKIMETSRLLLVLVGDLNADDVKQMVAASLGKLPRGSYKDVGVPALDFSQGTLDVTSRQLPTNYINGIFAAPSLKDPDYFAMRVAVSLLNDRVFEEVRVKRNLSYAPSADLGSLAANTGTIYVTAVDANQSIRIMLGEINSLKSKPVTDRELLGVKGQFLTTYFISDETNAAQAAELARYELMGGGWRKAFDYLTRVREVKPQDVQTVAQKYMKNLRFVVLGNPASIDRSVLLQNLPTKETGRIFTQPAYLYSGN